MSKRIFLALLFSAGICGCRCTDKDPASAEQVAVPKKVLLYYGYHSLANGSNWNINNALSIFSSFDIIVLGHRLQNPDHPEHYNTRQLVSSLVKNGKKVYGYIPLGLTDLGEEDMRLTSKAQIEKEINKWNAMGITGVFDDEMEAGYGVDRTRQNYLIDYAH